MILLLLLDGPPSCVQMASCSAMHGNKLYTLQPNLSEQLVELRVMSLTLPDEIELLKAAKRRDKEQVGGRVGAGGAGHYWPRTTFVLEVRLV